MNLIYEKDVKLIIDVLQELRHIVEDEGYETNVDEFLKLTNRFKKGGIEELNFCISKRCEKEEFHSEELEEFIDRLQDLLNEYKLNIEKNFYRNGNRTYFNIFISKKKDILVKEANDMRYISEKDAGIIVDVLQELRHIVEDEGFGTNIDRIIKQHIDRGFKKSPIDHISCQIDKKIPKNDNYAVGIQHIDWNDSEEFLEFFDRLRDSLSKYKISCRDYEYTQLKSVTATMYIDIRKKLLNENKIIDPWKEGVLESINRIKYIVEDEGYAVETVGNLSNVVVCRINKKIVKGYPVPILYESDEDIVEFVERVEEETNSVARIQNFMSMISIQFRRKGLSSYGIHSMGKIDNKFSPKEIKIVETKSKDNFILWISKISKTIEDLKYIVEDEGYRVIVDTTGHAPILCSIQKKIDKDLGKYGVSKKYIPYSISGYGSDESIEEFIDRLKEESNCELKVDNNNTNICIRFYEKQLKMFESSSIDELECSYPPIPFTKYDVDKILETVEELRYIIEDEGYITNFDKLKHMEMSDVYADVSLYISKRTSDILNGLVSDELEEFIHRLIDDLPNFYFGSYGNTLRTDNFKDYIRHNIKSGGSRSLYFTFSIYKRKKSGIANVSNESIDHLKRRGVNKETTRFIYDELSGDTYFFLYNMSGQLTGYQKYNPAYPKTGQNKLSNPKKAKYFISSGDEGSGKKIAVWGLETLNIKDRYLFITEGIFDCVKIHNAGYPGVAVLCNDPSTSMRNWLGALPQKKIVIYDNDQAGRYLKTVGDYSFCVPGSNKDLGNLTQEEANRFIKGCIDKIESKKINEELVDKEELNKNYKIVLDEIFSIKYLVEDFGAKVVVRSIGLLEIYPAIGMISTKEKLDEYVPLYEEFIERCQDICNQNGFRLISDFSSGSNFDKKGGKWINWKFNIKPNRKVLFNK